MQHHPSGQQTRTRILYLIIRHTPRSILIPSAPVISPDLFFLRIRPPPKSTLFPYTTLFRSVYTYTISAPTVTIPAGGSSTVACPSLAVAPTPPVVTDNCGRTITPSAPVISQNATSPVRTTDTNTYTVSDNTSYT